MPVNGYLYQSVLTPVIFLACLALLVCPVEAASESFDSANKHRIDRYNWVQLRAEQKAYQQTVEPLTPAEQQKLNLQLQQQRLQQRNLQLRQDQRLQTERYQRYINGSVVPDRIYHPGPSTQWQEQQQQRLQMRMQRYNWPYSRPR
jgi:hypothetical protein